MVLLFYAPACIVYCTVFLSSRVDCFVNSLLFDSFAFICCVKVHPQDKGPKVPQPAMHSPIDAHLFSINLFTVLINRLTWWVSDEQWNASNLFLEIRALPFIWDRQHWVDLIRGSLEWSILDVHVCPPYSTIPTSNSLFLPPFWQNLRSGTLLISQTSQS